MTTFTIIAEKPVSMAELKEELAHVKERDGELNFRAQKTEEYLAQFIDMDKQKAAALLQKLQDMNIPRLKIEYLIKLVDLMPASQEEVKALLSGYSVTMTNDNCAKIAAAIEEVAGQK